MNFWTSYDIDRVRGTFGSSGSSISESNHAGVNSFVLKNIEGIYRSMQQLMKKQNKLIMNSNDILVKEYASLKLVNIKYSHSTDEKDISLFLSSKLLPKKGCKTIKRSYEESQIIFPLLHDNGNILLSDV